MLNWDFGTSAIDACFNASKSLTAGVDVTNRTAVAAYVTQTINDTIVNGFDGLLFVSHDRARDFCAHLAHAVPLSANTQDVEGPGISGCGHLREYESALIQTADAMHSRSPSSLVVFASPYLADLTHNATFLDWGRLARHFDMLQPQMYCDLLQGQPGCAPMSWAKICLSNCKCSSFLCVFASCVLPQEVFCTDLQSGVPAHKLAPIWPWMGAAALSHRCSFSA